MIGWMGGGDARANTVLYSTQGTYAWTRVKVVVWPKEVQYWAYIYIHIYITVFKDASMTAPVLTSSWVVTYIYIYCSCKTNKEIYNVWRKTHSIRRTLLHLKLIFGELVLLQLSKLKKSDKHVDLGHRASRNTWALLTFTELLFRVMNGLDVIFQYIGAYCSVHCKYVYFGSLVHEIEATSYLFFLE